jgi:hypothetical protein
MARAQAVAKVRQSAQPPADWSVQQLMQRRRWAVRRRLPPVGGAHALKRTLRLASPPPPKGHSGWHRRRCALPVRLRLPVTPNPLQRALRLTPLLDGNGRVAPGLPANPAMDLPLAFCFVPPSIHGSQCNATGFLLQGLHAAVHWLAVPGTATVRGRAQGRHGRGARRRRGVPDAGRT